jgi:dCMP deaminase
MLSPNIFNTLNPHLDKWDHRFIRIANEVQSWSKDPSTKCGCVLVKDRRILSTGYNGLPANLSDSLTRYQDREYKLATIIHAEKNAIFNAAKNGSTTEGSTAYVTWPPCSQCSSALIQAGVSKVVCPDPNTAPERWKTNFKIANELLYEAGVTVLYFADSLQCPTETAPYVAHTGSTVSSIGQRENPVETPISMHLFAADFLSKRRSDA